MATGSNSLICICKPFAYIAVFFKTVFTGKQVDVDVERKQRSLNHRRKLHRATYSCTLPDQLHDMYGLTCHYHTVERWLKQGRFMHRWPTCSTVATYAAGLNRSWQPVALLLRFPY